MQGSAQGCGEHPHPTPCSSPGGKTQPGTNTGQHKAKKAPTANPTSRGRKYPSSSLKCPLAVLVGAQAVLTPDEENALTPCGSDMEPQGCSVPLHFVGKYHAEGTQL